MKDRAGQSGTKAGHVPNCPSDKAGQDGTPPYRVSQVSRLSQKLAAIHCLEELYGFANRRKVLGITDDKIAPRWTENERRMILARKYELQKAGK